MLLGAECKGGVKEVREGRGRERVVHMVFWRVKKKELAKSALSGVDIHMSHNATKNE